jgi:HEPN domain-containing protein
MEAMFLLWHEHRNISYRYKPVTAEQLTKEKSAWEYFPANINEEQLANPYLIIQKFFEKYSLAVYRDHLYEWLDMALSRTENRDPDLDAEEVITVYENMLELYAAAWMISQRHSDRPHLNKNQADALVLEKSPVPEPAEKESLEHFNIAEQVKHQMPKNRSELLQPLYPEPSPACALGLQKLREKILERYANVQLIIYLGCHPEPFTYYLLLLVSEEEKTEEGHLSTNIENHLQSLAHTYIILHKASSAKSAVDQGSRFWNEALSKGLMVYSSDDLPVIEAKPVSQNILLERAQFHWNLWGNQGEELLKGAAFFYESGNYRQAASLLHRATETILKGIIQAVLGYRIQMHNLARLLRLTLLFTDSLQAVFELHTQAGSEMFEFLKTAYAQAHYNNNFKPDETIIKLLLEQVRKLYCESLNVYHSYSQ